LDYILLEKVQYFKEEKKMAIVPKIPAKGKAPWYDDFVLYTNQIDLDFVHKADNLTETITGVKTFESYPKLETYLPPTLDTEFVTKKYVDDNFVKPVIDFYDPTGGLPPGPNVGDRYIASATGNGWTKDNIYEYNGSSWNETVVSEGMATWVENLDLQYIFNGTSWVTVGGGGKVYATKVVKRGSNDGTADYYCDGVDDQLEIQQAIDAVGALGGGKVVLREGTYILSNYVLLNYSHITVEGFGPATILKAKDNCSIFASYGLISSDNNTSEIVIRNITFDGNRTNNTERFGGVRWVGTSTKTFENWVIEGCIFREFYNADWAGGAVGNHNQGCNLNKICVRKCKFYDFTQGWGINLRYATEVSICNNFFKNVQGPIGLEYNSSYGVINNNEISYCSSGITLGSSGTVSYVTISGNYIHHSSREGPYGGGIFGNNSCYNIVVTGNIISDNVNGMLLWSDCDYWIITGNLLKNNQQKAIWVYGSGSERNLIHGNNAYGSGTAYVDGGTGTKFRDNIDASGNMYTDST